MAKKVQEVDPLSAYGHSNAGGALHLADRHEEALKACERALELEPKAVLCLYFFGLVCLKMGRYDDSIKALEEAAAQSGRASYLLGRLGAAYAAAGRRADAEKLLRELKQRAEGDYVAPLNLAYLHAALGDRDAAFDCLELAYQERTAFLVFLNVDKPLAGLKDDSRFDGLLRRMGLLREAPTTPSPPTPPDASASDIGKSLTRRSGRRRRNAA
jgi:serine/threonine-protein kinase